MSEVKVLYHKSLAEAEEVNRRMDSLQAELLAITSIQKAESGCQTMQTGDVLEQLRLDLEQQELKDKEKDMNYS